MEKQLISILLFLLTALGAWAQELTVKSFGVAQGDLAASVNPRTDRNGVACGLVKVQLVGAGATFEGNIIGNVSFQNNEYWVYMNEGAYLLNVSHPDCLPMSINLHDHGLKDGVQPKTTYKLALAKEQSTDIPTQKFIINYSPASAIVIVDSKSYQGNGHLELDLPVGSHDYQIVEVGYGTAEGSVKLNAQSPRKITETLQRNEEPAVQSAPVKPIVQASSPAPVTTDASNAAVEIFTVDGVTFKMVRVEGGTFKMGSKDRDADDDEKPVHQVTLSSYAIGETEVTQELWQAVMDNNPSDFKGSNLPVEQVSWEDCQEFISKMNAKTGRSFRLPTEAEWEFAARGGNKSKGYKYSGSKRIDDVAWCWENSGDYPLSGEWDDKINSNHCRTHPVKTKQANELGLYDMSGNVYEWCLDWYGSYGSSAQTNPTGPDFRNYRVSRGGSWYFIERNCRSSSRFNVRPSGRHNFLGLRLAL